MRQDQPSPAEERQIDRLAEEIELPKPFVTDILGMSGEIHTATIDRIMEIGDAELKVLLAQLPHRP